MIPPISERCCAHSGTLLQPFFTGICLHLVDPVVDVPEGISQWLRCMCKIIILNPGNYIKHFFMGPRRPLRNAHRVCATCGAAALHATLDSADVSRGGQCAGEHPAATQGTAADAAAHCRPNLGAT